MKKRSTLLCTLAVLVLCLLLLPTQAKADSESDWLFELNADGASYSVTGYVGDDSVNLIIPSTYEGKPVTSVGNYAFCDRASLTSITIHKGITTIGSAAFDGCISLTGITIPDSVTSIGDSAFQRCTSLTSITIPRSVTNIGYSAFFGCANLIGIWVDENNSNYSSDSHGVLFNKEKTSLICAPGGFNGSYSVPDSVTNIEWEAFRSCHNLTGIWVSEDNPDYSNDGYGVLFDKNKTCIICVPGGIKGNYVIPSTATSVGAAFCGCTKLTSITIPDGFTVVGSEMFLGCTGLTSITIPDSVTSIEWSAFSGCTSLSSITIPDSVTTICDFAFSGCTALNSITIGNGVTSIGENAFCGCTKLTSITIPDSVTSIGSNAFSDCTGLISITIPDSLTSLGNSVFFGCSKLTSVAIPNGVTSIGSAFSGCTGLKSITIPDRFNSIDDSAFSGCTSLTNITIPNSVISIGAWAFRDCRSLTSITIPNSVTSIDGMAFSNCTSLSSISIPESITSIGQGAFSGCDSLSYNTYDDAKYLGNQSNPYLVLVECISYDVRQFQVHNDTKIIYCNALNSKDRLTTAIIPKSVVYIGCDAFSMCPNLKQFYYTGTQTEWEQVDYIHNYTEGEDSIPPEFDVGIDHCSNRVVFSNIEIIYNYTNAGQPTKTTATPTKKPEVAPNTKPTAAPTTKPTAAPTTKPTAAPTTKPVVVSPTAAPTIAPTTESTEPATKVEITHGGIVAVPETLKQAGLKNPEEVKDVLRKALVGENSEIIEGNIAHYDVILQYTQDGGKTWLTADETHFPENGRLMVILPYPAGTDETYTFIVAHMFTSSAFGKVPGEVELPKVTNTADGIQFEVTGLSPISLGWTVDAADSATETTTAPTTEATNAPTQPTESDKDAGGIGTGAIIAIVIIAVVLAAAGGCAAMFFAMKKKMK